MRISHKHKFVFLSNPRCGSTSIRSILKKYSDILSTRGYPYYHHTGARELKRHFEEQGWNWEEYTIITTIRNPWDRVVSIWHYGQKKRGSIWHEHCNSCKNFHDFVIGLPDFLDSRVYCNRTGMKGISIDEFAYSVEGHKLVNHILPIERINTTLPSILKSVGLPHLLVPRTNVTDRSKYTDYYNGEQEIVSQIFKFDIKIGNYAYI